MSCTFYFFNLRYNKINLKNVFTSCVASQKSFIARQERKNILFLKRKKTGYRSRRTQIVRQLKSGRPRKRYDIDPICFDLDEPSSSGVNHLRITGISNDYCDEGDQSYTCSACGAKLWLRETRRGRATKGLRGSFSMCCLKGKIVLPEFTKDPPKLLYDLFSNKHPKSKHFLDNVRQYNMVFAFTSMGGKVDNSVNKGKGSYTFRIRGQNCHRMGGLVPKNGDTPKYSQLYIYDTANESANKKNAIGGTKGNQPASSKYSLDDGLIKDLMELLDNINPLVKIYRMARDRFEETQNSDFKIKLIARRSGDGRNYNLPTVDEVAALIVGDIDMEFDKRDIVVESQKDGLQRISELHPHYLALQYPLLFAYAEDGYRPDIFHKGADSNTKRKKKRVTMREFFAYKIQDRSVPTIARLARKLHQQLLVDAYTMIESERILYIQKNQKLLRADTYSNLTVATITGDVVNSMLGNRIKLPASFTGSARYMIENYRDAMALCRVYGYPDLFITFTCNSKWPKIKKALEGTGLNAEDKPEYQARVFKMKLDRLMEDIKRNKIFEKAIADLYTVEFQKRGLPHAHICIFLDERDKLHDPEDEDKFISAEIPDKEEDPELYKRVSELMMHGPCGKDNPKCPCTDIEKKCTKNFPKTFADETSVDTEGYLIYKRRDNGRIVTKQGIDLDNRFVVPYNAHLLKKYQAHINVEWCNQIALSYINKGNDRVTAGVCDEDTDEIKEYYDCRYISSCEAIWRMLAFDIHQRNPTVVRLAFHLEDQQSIIFDEEDLIEDVLDRPSVNKSQFLEWMKCNQKYETARQLTYVEFPTKVTTKAFNGFDRTYTSRVTTIW
ncbi:uncharacterized protein [Rutidosis leptorrhynchoides]|uniref:uncharacterized protein n=1 Tax=Rutidosis leptorrhynchoides TaxID=125765 RepID=UPI003A99A404